jgi:hypothetical protein
MEARSDRESMGAKKNKNKRKNSSCAPGENAQKEANYPLGGKGARTD